MAERRRAERAAARAAVVGITRAADGRPDWAAAERAAAAAMAAARRR
jgi:hypothetical protein